MRVSMQTHTKKTEHLHGRFAQQVRAVHNFVRTNKNQPHLSIGVDRKPKIDR